MERTVKVVLIVFAVLIVLAGVAVLSGCASLVPGYQRAKDAYEVSKAETEKMTAMIETARAEVAAITAAYNEAKGKGDTSAMQAAAAALPEAMARVGKLEEMSQQTAASFEKAAAQFEDANSAQDYISTILGLVMGAFGGGLGGNLLGKRTARKQAAKP